MIEKINNSVLIALLTFSDLIVLMFLYNVTSCFVSIHFTFCSNVVNILVLHVFLIQVLTSRMNQSYIQILYMFATPIYIYIYEKNNDKIINSTQYRSLILLATFLILL